jgi:hypothetical protein
MGQVVREREGNERMKKIKSKELNDERNEKKRKK